MSSLHKGSHPSFTNKPMLPKRLNSWAAVAKVAAESVLARKDRDSRLMAALDIEGLVNEEVSLPF
jgi:hypothetical protein